MVKEDVITVALEKFDSMESLGRWNFANQLLYNLCEEHPKHDDADEIVAKLWLIGRSYAAAIERRKNATGFHGDFYYDIVAPAMLNASAELDEMINAINNSNSERNIDLVLKCHGFLTKKFSELTKLDKRSLASKYLHFHCRESVYIYDSIASSSVKKLVKKDTKRVKEICNQHPEYDAEYVDFYIRAQELQKYLTDKFDRNMSTRDIDTMLLLFAAN